MFSSAVLNTRRCAADGSYSITVVAFAQTIGHFTGGFDQTQIYGARTTDLLFGDGDFARLSGPDRYVWVDGMDRLTARAADDEIANQDIRQVDYLFALLGQWS